MEDLQRATEELKHIGRMVQEQFERAKQTEQEIDEKVNQWLKEAQKIGEIMKSNWPIDEKAKPSLMKRFFFSKHQAKKSEEDASNMINQVNALVDRGKSILCENFNTDTKGIELVWRGDFVEFESRRDVCKWIMDALKDKEDGIIGVFGMGGIGKTKLAVEIGKKAQDEELFSKVVMATVSQSPNVRNIQGMLADMVNLKFKEDTETGRSDELRKKLGKERKVLVILDDVWEKIDIEHFGIPKGCRIVLTSRREEVCRNMGCISSMCLNQITYEEAKSLFKIYASIDRRPDLEESLEKIVKECGGLPLALVTIGSALRHKGLEEFKHAARKLSESSFVGIEAADRNVYASLKLSYDYLDDIETQKCFLLCSLYPEDTEIKVEALTRYAYGLCLFRDVESVDHARQKMIASVSKLEKACLLSLLKDEDLDFMFFLDFDVPFVNYLSIVRMHDVIRDVALWIARSDGLFFVPTSLKECRRKDMSEKRTAIYLNSQDLLALKNCPQELECPNLEILLLYGSYGVRPITLPVNFFRKASSLRVLDLEMEFHRQHGDRPEMSMQVFVQYLVNLKVLRVLGGLLRNDVGMSIMHNLKSLEILELSFPSDVKVLPGWIGELCNLRVLNLTESYYLEEIPPNMLPKLAKLEELYTPMLHETTWSHAFLSDLTFLRHLSVFTGCFSRMSIDPYRLAQHRILELDDFNDESMKMLEPLRRGVTNLQIGMSCMEGIQNLSPHFENSSFLNLWKLSLFESKSLECLIDTTTERGQRLRSIKVLANLFHLKLLRMEQLCRICNGPPPPLLNFLGNLRNLHISSCPRIENLIPDMLPVASPLSRLYIVKCGALKSLYDPVQTTRNHQLPNLSCESDKQKLINVGHGDAELHTTSLDALLVSLTKVEINDCSNLEEVFPSVSEINNQHCNWKLTNLSYLSLCRLPKLECIWKGPHQNYCLLNLKIVNLYGCDKLSSVFTTTLAQTLVKLESLEVSVCTMLETIISPNELDEASKKMPPSSTSGRCHKLKTVLPMMFAAKCLPKLQEIRIRNCKALEEVFGTREENKTDSQTQDVVIQHLGLEIVFQELSFLTVESCHKLQTVLPMMFAAKCLPMLSSIKIINCEELEEVFDTREENKTDSQTHDVVMPRLKHLELVDLPKLVPFSEFTWNQILPSLRTLVISGTFKQDTDILVADGQVFSSSNTLFSQEAIQNGMLPIRAARYLRIMDVNFESFFSNVEEVFDVQDAEQPILDLHVLKLGYMAKVQRLWRGPAKFINLCYLEKIEVYNCPAIKSLFPHNFCWTLDSLRSLEVYNCKELKYIFEPGDHEEHSLHRQCFPKLHSLYVSNCEMLESIFHACVVQDFPSLEWPPSSTSGRTIYLKLRRLKTVSQTQDVVMQSLRHLELVDLPKLVPFSKFTWSKILPPLDTLIISGTTFKQAANILHAGRQEMIHNGMLPIRAARNLRKMEVNSESFFSSVEEVFDVQDAEQPILTGLYVLKLGYMAKVQRLWRGPAEFINLCNLEEIEVYNCPAIKSLFPHSFCWALRSLNTLKVYNCKELKNIFEPGDHEEHSLHGRCFPKLERLHVNNCEILESIFPVCVVQDFSCLKFHEVHDCPKLENININVLNQS